MKENKGENRKRSTIFCSRQGSTCKEGLHNQLLIFIKWVRLDGEGLHKQVADEISLRALDRAYCVISVRESQERSCDGEP